MKQFTNLYQLQKTLRFELIPTEETKAILKNEGNKKREKKLLEADKKRSQDFLTAKEVADRLHRDFIDRVLDTAKNDDSIIALLPKCNTEDNKKELRKKIAEKFQKDSQYKTLFGEDLFAKENIKKGRKESPIYSYAKKKAERDALESFKDFTVFFSGYNENRKNMYVDKKQNTAIAYRIANVNLPKFEFDISCYQKIVEAGLVTALNKNRRLKKLLNGKSCEDIFKLDYYVNFWKQSDIDTCNEIVGIINTVIKEYNDRLTGKKKSQIPLMVKLYKQILGFKEDDKNRWEYRGFNSDEEMLTAVGKFYDVYKSKIAEKLKHLLENIHTYDDQGGIYVHQKSLRTISSFVFDDGYAIARSLIPQKPDETYEDYKERIKKGNKSFSISTINKKANLNLCQYFSQHSYIKRNDGDDKDEKKEIFDTINEAYNNAEEIIANAKNNVGKRLAGSGDEEKIRKLLDSLKILQHFVQPLLGKGDEKERDWSFYNELTELWEDFLPFNILYDKVRSRITKKPFTQDKINVIFDVKRNFLSGWTDNMTASDNGTQYGGYLFRKKNAIGEFDYYVGICRNTTILRRKEGVSGDYERLEYYQVAYKTFRHYYYHSENGYDNDMQSLMNSIVSFIEATIKSNDDAEKFFLRDLKEKNSPHEMIKILQEQSPSKLDELKNDKDFSAINKVVIETLRESIMSISRLPNAQGFNNKNYELFTDIDQDIRKFCQAERVFTYYPVSDEEITNAQNDEEKPLLLFKISNKDLSFAETFNNGSRTSRGTENLHTMYFKALMEGNQKVFDLGSGQIFFREKSIPQKVTHPAGIPIENKNERVRTERPDRTLDYDLIKDKRYTEDKLLFHLSIVINYPEDGLPKPDQKKAVNAFMTEFNNNTLDYLRQNKQDINIIGIDRGERNLIYVSLINIKGEHLSQEFPRCYNLISNFDYQKKLKQVAKNRDEERKNWTIPEKITDIKKGYLSQVVHEIASLAVRHHAIIVMENLSRGFKNGRFPIEHQVYQLFENMLIEKLSYFAFKKDSPAEEYGNIKNGVQLAVPLNKPDWLNQNGWVFYVPAAYTSKIDPATGFANLFNIAKAKKDIRGFFRAFDSIRYENRLFHFEFDYDKEDTKSIRKSYISPWHLTSHGERIIKNKSEELTPKFEAFFTESEIPLENVSVESICNLGDEQLKEFFELFMLLLKMRNSNEENDFIISPVASDAPFVTGPDNFLKIADADANGAYNIALKGLYWLHKDFPMQNGLLRYIRDEDWFEFIQDKPYLKD